jgi:hypothetical protein
MMEVAVQALEQARVSLTSRPPKSLGEQLEASLMAIRVVDDFTVAWTADASGLWSATADTSASNLGADGYGMAITASAGSASGPDPYVQRVFSPSLDLRDWVELRLWVRSDRAATGAPDSPFYLVVEASTDPADPSPSWSRFVRISQANRWELQRLYLGDMPDALRQAVAMLRVRGTDRTTGFNAAVDDLCASVPQAIEDLEAALLSRLDQRFSATDGGPTVPAVVNVPEGGGTPAMPYILMSPWGAMPLTDFSGDEEIDNETAAGAYVRPHPRRLRLDYRIDVYADDRAQKARLLDAVIADLGGTPRLVAGDEPLMIVPFEPDPVLSGQVLPGQTSLYYRVLAWYEAGARVFLARAVPYILTAPLDGTAQPEVTLI